MDRKIVQQRIAELDDELDDWFKLAANRQLDQWERSYSGTLERRIDRLRLLLSSLASKRRQ